MKSSCRATLLIACAASAGSIPYSRAGVLDTPDAYVLSHTELQIGLTGTAYSVADTSGATDSEFKITGHVDVGLFRFGQAGVSWLDDGGIAGSVKIGVLSEGIQVPAFAIGLENISGNEDIDCFDLPDGTPYPYQHSQNFSAYGVLSKNLQTLVGVPATLSVGIGTGRFVGVIDNGALGLGSSVASGFFGSIVFRPSNSFQIAFEEDGRDLNMGMTYDVSRDISVSIAWAEFEMALFPPEDGSEQDIMQNSKFSVSVEGTFGPLFGARQLELEREQQRIERARQRLQELEDRRRAAEEELQRLRELLEQTD